ncbi:hypothetical protein CEXT_388441, partial [Caerostris extrusa]
LRELLYQNRELTKSEQRITAVTDPPGVSYTRGPNGEQMAKEGDVSGSCWEKSLQKGVFILNDAFCTTTDG